MQMVGQMCRITLLFVTVYEIVRSCCLGKEGILNTYQVGKEREGGEARIGKGRSSRLSDAGNPL